jgi:hypothetical protein
MPDNRRRRFATWISRPETIIGICAVVVSVVAVAISAYEAHLQREWQRAAVWPYIQLGRSFQRTNSAAEPEKQGWKLTINAENVGVGPAHVRDFRVTVDGKPQPDWRAAMRALLRSNDDIKYGQSTILNIIVPPQRKVEMFQYVDHPDAEKIYGEMDRLTYTACFCSVFDECWVTTSRDTPAKEVDRCVPDKDSFRE